MKKGKAYIACVWIDCPSCGGPVSDENGSHMISWIDGGPLSCDDCGTKVEMPKTVKKEARP